MTKEDTVRQITVVFERDKDGLMRSRSVGCEGARHTARLWSR